MTPCDGCTLCCELLRVPELDKPAGIMCDHCDGTKCTIHTDRPEVCRKFECVYSRMDDSHIRTRPDNMGIVWEKPCEDIFHGTTKYSFDELTDDAKSQIMAFNRQGYTVFVRAGFLYKVWCAEGHDEQEMQEKLNRIAKERDGST